MSVIESTSLIYQIVSGEYAGKKCIIWDDFGTGEFCGVILENSNGNDVTQVPRCFLSQLEIPGWEAKIYEETYGLIEFMTQESGSGRCMLRTATAAQPRTLREGDILATGEIVVEAQRKGYNETPLVRLSQTGWVEIANRLPVALKGNLKFKLPAELEADEMLITTCIIVGKPCCIRLNWVIVCLDTDNCRIDIPSCIPLALA